MLSIIIVNWNGHQHLEVCLNSLFKQTYKDFKVIFVDNGSTDDSVRFVKDNFPHVKVIECQKNYGFAEGNNIGIREAMKDSEMKYIVTLNNDTMVKEDWLEQLVKPAEQDKKIAVCASKLIYFDERDKIDSAGDFYYKGSLKVFPRGHGKPDTYFKQEECLSACAAAALYRREALEEAKLNNDYFDSDYFAYIEDSDLALRIRLMDWKCVFVPTAVVYHKVSATTSKLKEDRKKFYSVRNRIFTIIKLYPVSLWQKALKNPITYQKVKSNLINDFIFCVKLFCNVLVSLPKMLRKRKIIQKNKRVSDNIYSEWQNKFSIEEN